MGSVGLEVILTRARATSELDGQTVALELRPILYRVSILSSPMGCRRRIRNLRNATSGLEIGQVIEDLVAGLPGTISLASNASSYSMKPKPFMSLTSVMLPVP